MDLFKLDLVSGNHCRSNSSLFGCELKTCGDDGMRVKLKELGEIVTGNTPSKQVTEFWDSDDICFVKPDTITASLGIRNLCPTRIL